MIFSKTLATRSKTSFTDLCKNADQGGEAVERGSERYACKLQRENRFERLK